MNTVEFVKKICKERKIPISRLERDLGFSNGYIGQLKKGTFPDDRLVAISKYLEIPVDVLIKGGFTSNIPGHSELTKVYFSLAKEAQDNGIDPDDIRLALDTIMKLRGGK